MADRRRQLLAPVILPGRSTWTAMNYNVSWLPLAIFLHDDRGSFIFFASWPRVTIDIHLPCINQEAHVA